MPLPGLRPSRGHSKMASFFCSGRTVRAKTKSQSGTFWRTFGIGAMPFLLRVGTHGIASLEFLPLQGHCEGAPMFGDRVIDTLLVAGCRLNCGPGGAVP